MMNAPFRDDWVGGAKMADVGAPGVSLGSYLSALRRRWLTVILTTVLGVALASAYLFAVPPTYTATAEVSISVITSDPFNASRAASGLLDMPGEARVAGSHAVAERAADILGEMTPQAVRKSIEVTGSADSTTLRISATGDRPDTARRIADVVADQYLDFRSSQADERIARTVQAARDRLADERARLLEATQRLAEAKAGSAEAVQAETDRSLLNFEISSTVDQLTAAQSIDTAGGFIINPAAAAPVDRQPSSSLILATGLLAGLATGLLLAFAVDAFDRRIRTSADVLTSGAGPFVVELPGRSDSIPPSHADLDQLLTLREHLLDRPELRDRRGVVAVVDLSGGGGARQVPLALAMVQARGGTDVHLVALAADRSIFHHAMDRLDLVPAAEHENYGTYTATAAPGLTVTMVEAPADELGEEALPDAVAKLVDQERQERLVVLGLPPGSRQASRYRSMRLADVVLLIAAVRRTPRTALAHASTDIRSLGVGLMGTVLVGRRRRAR